MKEWVSLLPVPKEVRPHLLEVLSKEQVVSAWLHLYSSHLAFLSVRKVSPQSFYLDETTVMAPTMIPSLLMQERIQVKYLLKVLKNKKNI